MFTIMDSLVSVSHQLTFVLLLKIKFDGAKMKCPHCLVSFHEQSYSQILGEDKTSRWDVIHRQCPNCRKFIISLQEDYERYDRPDGRGHTYHERREFLCYPKGYTRTPLGPEVPKPFAEDYREACQTLSDSPKASAALSRRCLQHVLREKAGIKKGNLAEEIQQVIDSGKLPTLLMESLDAVRNIGNFAAHPIKSTATGEIIDVEPGEAEWTLDVLEALFDFYFTQPALLKKKRDELNAKLTKAGKPAMK